VLKQIISTIKTDNMNKILILLFSLLFSTLFSQNSLVRYPSIDPLGKNIAFVFQGDIWVMNLENKQTNRITIHNAYDALPVWSPDGEQIAFSSNRFGSMDVFVINKNGSGLKRLTYHPSFDRVNSWTQKNRIIFETKRLTASVERDNELFYVSPDGGNPKKLMDAFGSYAVESPDEKNVAFVIGSCRISRQAYQGSANKDIWIYNKKNKSYKQLTTNSFNEFAPSWLNNEALLFISSTGGDTYQLVSQKLTEEQAQVLADFKEFGLRHYSYAQKAQKAVMESGMELEILDLKTGKRQDIDTDLTFESRKNHTEHQTYTGGVSNYDVSPNGKYIVTEIKGNLFLSLAKDKDNFTKALTNDSYFNTQPLWLNDSAIIYRSNKSKKNEIYLLSSNSTNEPNLFRTLKLKNDFLYSDDEDIFDMVLSNKMNQIALRVGDGKLVVADIDENGKITNQKILNDSWAPTTGLCWSPDDKYLAYSQTNLDFNREIYIQAANNTSDPVNVSMHPRTDISPSWSPDGKMLAFASIRNNSDYDIWYVWLQKSDYEKSIVEKKYEEAIFEEEENENDSVVVKIDFVRIYDRLFQLTRLPGNETNPIFSKESDFIYFNSNSNENGKTDLYKIRWDGKEIKELTKKGTAGREMSLGPESKYLYLLKKGGKPGRLNLSGDKMQNIPIKAEADWNYKEVRVQVFETAWQAINQRFYDPDFHGKDWEGLKNKYKPIALSASTDEDFRSIFNWMLGEINASHMGLRGPREKTKNQDKTALLGIEFESQKRGIKIIRVLPESPADKSESQLMKDDVILTINQKEIEEEDNFYRYLVNQADKPTLLKIDRGGNEMEIEIRPTDNLTTAKYNDWVAFNRKLVDKYSKGRLGYLHIRAMGWSSFERFERDLMAAAYGKEGIVIDVRYNGGGWTTDYLMAVLNVKQHAYTIPRGATEDLSKNFKDFREHYAFGERLPFASWTKPSIALCNQNSYSNAEIFSHAYKHNEIGTLVGTPTFGAVISTGSKSLMDGSYVRIPFRAWFVKATDENMELVPAIPDIIVNLLPDSRAKGNDEQLQKAVEVLLEELGE
jgi:tricorn protease